MRQDLKWDTLETIRRHARLSVVHKMYYGFLDGKWEDYLCYYFFGCPVPGLPIGLFECRNHVLGGLAMLFC